MIRSKVFAKPSFSRAPAFGQGAAPAPVYDPDAAAFFARLTTQPGDARKQLINERFIAGKAKSFWSKLDAIWVHAAHGAEAARLNWLGNIYNCTPVNNPTFTADRGYMGDGSSSYLDTGFDPTIAVNPKHTQNSAALGVRSNTDNVGAGSLAGFFDGAKGTTLNPRDGNVSNRMASRIHQSGATSSPNNSSPSAIGMFVANRIAAADIRQYREGVQTMISTIASVAPASGFYRLGSISNSSYRACQFSMGFISGGLTDQEVTDVFNWFEPYRIAVGVT